MLTTFHFLFLAVLNAVHSQRIDLGMDNCGQYISITEDFTLEFDLTLNDYAAADYIRILQIGPNLAFAYNRYQYPTSINRHFYWIFDPITGQNPQTRFEDYNAPFTTTNNGLLVHHRLHITQTSLTMQSDNYAPATWPKNTHTLSTNLQVCSPATGGASGFIDNFYFTTPNPTNAPSRHPTDFPTKVPSRYPTDLPTKVPSKYPTDLPSSAPSTSCVDYDQSYNSNDGQDVFRDAYFNEDTQLQFNSTHLSTNYSINYTDNAYNEFIDCTDNKRTTYNICSIACVSTGGCIRTS
eukprot:264903_1